MKQLNEFKKLDELLENKNVNIYDYLYYVGINDIRHDLTEEEFNQFIDICNEFVGDYTDPIILANELAHELYVNKNITLQELKGISTEDFYEWYDNGRLSGGSIRYCIEEVERPKFKMTVTSSADDEEKKRAAERMER